LNELASGFRLQALGPNARDTRDRPEAWSQKPEACPYGFVVPGAGAGAVPRPGVMPRPAGGVAGGVAAGGGVPRPAGAAAGGLAVGAGAAAAGLLVDAASNRLLTSAVMSSDGSMYVAPESPALRSRTSPGSFTS